MVIPISLLSLLSVSLVWVGRKFKAGRLIYLIEGKAVTTASVGHERFVKVISRTCYVLGVLCLLLIFKLLVINQHELAIVYSLSMMVTLPKALLLLYGAIRLICFH